MSSHEASTHHQEAGEPRSKTSMSASFWFVIILVGLFIAALNFINVMGNGSEGHVNKEATATGTLKGESGLGKPETESSQQGEGNAPGVTNDTLHNENAQH